MDFKELPLKSFGNRNGGAGGHSIQLAWTLVTRWMGPLVFAGILAITGTTRADAADSCENLMSLAIPNTAVTSASLVPQTTLNSGRGDSSSQPLVVPAHCRVLLLAKPVEDSEIHIEVWLPSTELWNGKFVGTGNGGYSSALEYREMQSDLSQGYSVAGSDTGHSGDDLRFVVGHRATIDDWGWRAVHVMTGVSSLVIHAYYARFAEQSYFVGCSTGGHQALMEAQRFPEDYDGIVAGDPGNDRVRLNEGFLWSWLAIYKDPSGALPRTKLRLINQAVIAACDAIDGVKDGVIGDPRRCHFDPETLLCKGADGADCLTAAQLTSVRAIYAGARNPRTGKQVFPGWVRGSELGWGAYFVGQPEPARSDFWRYWVFGDPGWDPRTFDFDKDANWADSKMAVIVADDPNLKGFRQRNGKLVMYEGWADPVVPPDDVIDYYESVERAMGGSIATQQFARLFMAPGMAHCGGGVGPNRFDALVALDNWVTRGAAPDRIIASHESNGTIDHTRPLCPYPQVARWNRKGDPNEAANFTCMSEAVRRLPSKPK